MNCKFFKWFLSGESIHTKYENKCRELVRSNELKQAEKIFAEIDNDLINQIDKATEEFKQAQLKYVPCQMVYYKQNIQKIKMKRIKEFLIKGFLNEGYSIGLENGGYYHSGSFHDNKHYIKYKESK